MQTLTDLKDRTQWAIDFISKRDNLNNAEIGRAVGSKPDTVRKYRAGVAAPRPNFLQKFCDSFGVDFQWLSNGVGRPFPGQEFELSDESDVSEPDDGMPETRELSSIPEDPLQVFEGGEPDAFEVDPVEISSSVGEPSVVIGMDSEMSFQKLAVLAGIKIDNEWILKLSKKLGIEAWKISLSIYKQQINNELIQCVEQFGFKKDEWMVRRESKKTMPAGNGDLNISQLLKITEEVLRSNTIHSTSLAMNIISLKMLAEKAASAPVLGARAINLPDRKIVQF